MDTGERLQLRSRLRKVNIEYSALVRIRSDQSRLPRMTALSVERKAIMQLLFRGERAMSRPVSIRQRVSAIPTSIAAE